MTDTHTSADASSSSHRYFEFLAALYRAKNTDQEPMVLESVDQRLLEIIAVQHYLNKPLSAMQLLNSRDVVFLGASTISRKLEALSRDGWIQSELDAADRRIKFIVPTAKAMAYFDRLNALMPE